MKTRDQSEDRQQSRYIVFGKETAEGVRYGVKARTGEVLMAPVQDADIATAWAANQDKLDEANAARKAAMAPSTRLPVTPEEDEAYGNLGAVANRFTSVV